MKEHPMRTSSHWFRLASRFACVALSLVAFACGEDKPAGMGGNENEVFTTITLTFTPSAGGAPVVAAFDDSDGDGGKAPTIASVMLGSGMFNLAVKFENKLENPPEDITEEIHDEANDHQIFFTGTAVNGPASNQSGAPLTHAYADTDSKGLPVGLENKITAAAGTGMLTVTLRHLPPVNSVAVKTASLAEMVRTSGGFMGLAGSTDVQVTFPVTVQ
jgi:hypothetical protein